MSGTSPQGHPALLRPVFMLAAAICAVPLAAGQELQYPLSVAAADDQGPYVADLNLPGVWKHTAEGWQPLFAGSKQFRTPLHRPRCAALDRPGRLLVGDSATRDVYRLGEDGTPPPLTQGGIGVPMDLAVSETGEVFVSDLELHCIWRFPSEGGVPEKLADVPAPRGLALDRQGRLLVVSHGERPVLRVDAAGKVEPVLSQAPFQFPHDLVLAEDEGLIVSDGYAKTLWKVSPQGEATAWIQGEPLVNPVGLAWYGQTLLVADPHARAVFQVDAEGKLRPFGTK